MTHPKILILGLLSLGFASAAAADASRPVMADIWLSGDVHAITAYSFRGDQFSNNEPSLGISLRAAHTSGVFATYDLNTIKLSAPVPDVLKSGGPVLESGFGQSYPASGSGVGRLQHTLTVGYDKNLAEDLRVGGGVSQNLFTGHDAVNDLSFGEIFGFAEWKGLTAKLSYNIDSAVGAPAGFAHGDLYGELGYTCRFGAGRKYSLGGDVGYHRYANQAHNSDVHAGVSVVNLRAGYAYNDHLSVGVTHQADGKDAYGNHWRANHTTMLDFKYNF